MPENSSCSSAGSCTKSRCEGCPSHNGGPQSFLVEQNKFSNIKHVIGVVSGKGGVGKSFVTSSLAVNMAKDVYKRQKQHPKHSKTSGKDPGKSS